MHEEVRAEIEAGWRDLVDRSAFVGGQAVADFERAFAVYCGAPHAVGVGSGTDALRIALQAVGVRRDDLVVTVPHTFIATVEAISQVGASPVFVDIDPASYTMDPGLVSRYLERDCTVKNGALVDRRAGRPVTCLLAVDLYGQPADWHPLLELAARFGLKVVEDACQAHGARYHGRLCGTFGDAGAFSFYPGKNLGAMGEAGAVTTGSAAVAERCRLLRDHGQLERYIHVTGEGGNARLDALQAVVLSAKLKRLDTWNDARRRVAARYDERLEGEDLVAPLERSGAHHVYHLYVVQLPDRGDVRRQLEARGIATGLHYPVPLHLQEAYAELGHQPGDFPVSERVAAQGLSLPMFPHLTEEQLDHVVLSLQAAVEATPTPASQQSGRQNPVAAKPPMEPRRVVILLENLPYPRDRRVRLEAATLRDAGYAVTVLAPAALGEPYQERVRGVEVRRFQRGPEGRGLSGYLREYAHAWWQLARLVREVRTEHPIDVLHACSPPDLFFPFAWWCHRSGTRFVFDHHDLSPELFLAKGGSLRSPLYWALRLAERASFRAADTVVSSNEPMARMARERGGVAADRVFVVRAGLEDARLQRVEPAVQYRHGSPHLVAYVGHMDRQDGVEYLLHAAQHVVHERGRSDVRFLLIGDGPERGALERLAGRWELSSAVEFAGYVTEERRLSAMLATADVCVTPDPVTPFTVNCTMLKVLDYMAAGRPQVAFPLPETEALAGEAVLIVEANSGRALAEGILKLLDDPDLRARMGEAAVRRAKNGLLWRESATRLLAAYERALGVRVVAGS